MYGELGVMPQDCCFHSYLRVHERCAGVLTDKLYGLRARDELFPLLLFPSLLYALALTTHSLTLAPRTDMPASRCVRVGGFKIVLIARFSAIAGHCESFFPPSILSFHPSFLSRATK
jgi:hypothetical protein